MKEIPLTQGKVTIVDDDMYPVLSQWRWCAKQVESGDFYAARAEKIMDGRYKNVHLHQAIMGTQLHGKVIDHINGNTLDNRRENLRVVSHRQNCSNRHYHRGKQKRLIGASYQADHKKWLAQAYLNGKKRFIGYFDTMEQAHEAYKNAIKNLVS